MQAWLAALLGVVSAQEKLTFANDNLSFIFISPFSTRNLLYNPNISGDNELKKVDIHVAAYNMVETEFISTIAGIASAGTKLSVTLYTFSETISTDHRYIKSIAQDVSLISSLLTQLDDDLKADDQASVYSNSTLSTAKEAVKECEDVFNEIRTVLEDAAELALQRSTKGKLTLSPLERSKWAFSQPKMILLMANLQKLKSTLVLVQNALAYADSIESG
jgi:hypothetical protein